MSDTKPADSPAPDPPADITAEPAVPPSASTEVPAPEPPPPDPAESADPTPPAPAPESTTTETIPPPTEPPAPAPEPPPAPTEPPPNEPAHPPAEPTPAPAPEPTPPAPAPQPADTGGIPPAVLALTDAELQIAATLFLQRNQKKSSRMGVESRQATMRHNLDNVLSQVRRDSPTRIASIAQDLNMPPGLAGYYLRKLVRQRKIKATGHGASRRYSA